MSVAELLRRVTGRRTPAVVPVDLVAAVGVTALAGAVVLAAGPGVARFWAAVPLAFFLPGYALVAALYPGAPRGGDELAEGGIGLAERLALSFGLSLAVLPLVGLALWAAGLWVSAAAVVAALGAVVLVGSAVGAVRRLSRPSGDRFTPPTAAALAAARAGFGRSVPLLDRVLNAALAVSVLLAAAALGVGLASPGAETGYTTAALLSPDGDGEPVASGYDRELVAGEPAAFVVALTNQEGVETEYTVVARLERVAGEGADATVTDAEELDRLSVTVAAGERRTVRHEPTPTTTGEQLRLAYYVYRGDAPETAGASSAYRTVYVWVSVEDA